MAALESRHWWFVARRRILRAVLGSLNLPPAARVVELGCGTGGNLALLSEFGAVTAVEMNAFARESARRTDARVTVLEGHLPDALPAMEPVDLVCLFDVLEHIEDDAASLRRIRALLVPGGYLVITVPAYPWLFGDHDRAHHHHRRYTAARLRALAALAGWQVERIGYFNTVLFPLVGLHRLAQRTLRFGGGSDARLPARWLNALLMAIFGAEAFWLRRHVFPFGVSILAVMRPRA